MRTQELAPTSDVVFKNIFSKKGNEEMLKELLEEIIKIPIRQIEVIKEVELSQMSVDEKYGKLDLRAVINKNAIVVIEMQNQDNCNMEKRAMYYAGKIIGSSLKIGETYETIKDIYVISILNYEMTELNKYMIETVTVDSDFRNYEVIEGLKYYFIELPKFRKGKSELKTKLEQWLIFLDYKRKDLIKMAIANNKLIEKANQDYEYLTGDEATRRLQELREKAILDENSAYATGVKRGEVKGKVKQTNKIAIEMLKNKVKKEIIIKCTGLDQIELDKIERQI